MKMTILYGRHVLTWTKVAMAKGLMLYQAKLKQVSPTLYVAVSVGRPKLSSASMLTLMMSASKKCSRHLLRMIAVESTRGP